MARIKFLNTEIDNLTMEETLLEVERLIEKRACSYLVTPNLDHIVNLEKDREFAEAYKHADLILADGKPLIWISNWLKNPIKEKVSGSDLFPRICALAAERDYSLFLLGAAEGVADIAAQNLQRKYPGLKIAGTYSPKFGFEKMPEELEKIKDILLNAKPDILALALGTPKCEKFIYRHREEYGIPLSISIGASVDFEAGKIKRAPRWMSDAGLEWLFRITQDPKRLAKRYWHDAASILPIIKKYRYQKDENTDRLNVPGR